MDILATSETSLKGVDFMAIRSSLKEKRIEKNILQSELANATGVHVKTICRIENGERNASLEIALRLATYFNCTVEDLFEVI